MANEFYPNQNQNPNPAPAPEYTAPQYTAPQYTAPQYNAPEYSAPAPEMPVPEAPAKKSKKGLFIALGAIAVAAIVAVVLFFVLGGGGGKYTTPLDIYMDQLNAKKYSDYKEATLNKTNGLFNDEAETVYSLQGDEDELKEDFEDELEDKKDEYGSNFKFTYEVEDKEKLDKDDLKDMEEYFRDTAESVLEEIEDTDVDDLADALDLSKADAKKYLNAVKSMYKTLKSADITEGYELEVTVYVDGKELDEREEYETLNITVVKLNGKWVDITELYNTL